MIPAKNRFPLRQHIATLSQTFTRFSSPHLVLYFSSYPFLRLAVVVPKKAAKKAVFRNRLKRILKNHLFHSSLKGNFVLFVRPRPLIKSKETEKLLLQELDFLLSRLPPIFPPSTNS